MTIEQFILLNDESQQEALSNAVCVADRNENEFDIYLFQLESFYVEVYYHRKLLATLKYRAFEDTNELRPYLKKIKLVFKKRKKLR